MTRNTATGTPDAPPPPAGLPGKPSSPSTQPAVGTSPEAPGSGAPQDGERLGVPHERDESNGDTAAEPDETMQQAKKDLDAGQVDTDLRNTAGTDDARRDELLRRER